MKSIILVLSLILKLSFASANYESVYTSLAFNDCITIESDSLLPEDQREIDFYNGVCPSFGGYVLGVSGGDIRYSPKLSYNGTNINLPRFGSFHDTGAKAEWRYERITGPGFNNELKFISLIYRINFDLYDEKTGESKSSSQLVVVKLDKEKSCVTGIVQSQSKMNEKARSIADTKSACIPLKTIELF